MNISYQPTIYNGVNHDVLLFDSKDIIVNRKGQHFLKEDNCTPKKIIRQGRPLSAHGNLLCIENGDSNIFLPEAYGSQLDTLSDYFNYSIIIVSSRYADFARQTHGGGNFDFLDRLFTPIPLYSSIDAHYSCNLSKIGSAGLKKVCFPKTPQNYVLELRAGQLPSVSAMQVCLSMYRDHRAYCDSNTSSWLRELESYLPSYNLSK